MGLPDGQIQSAPQPDFCDLRSLRILRRVGSGDQSASLIKQRNTRRHIPLPASTFPPYVKGTHGCVCEIQGCASQAPHAVHHATLAAFTLRLDRHGHEAFNFPTKVSLACIGVSAVLAPFAAKGAALGGIGGYWCALYERQALCLIEPCSFALTGREELIEEGRVDYSNYWLSGHNEGDGYAKHGEEMRVVDCSVQGVDTPRWVIRGDEIVFRRASRVRFFSNESSNLLA